VAAAEADITAAAQVAGQTLPKQVTLVVVAVHLTMDLAQQIQEIQTQVMVL
jgi:hypothetical protein